MKPLIAILCLTLAACSTSPGEWLDTNTPLVVNVPISQFDLPPNACVEGPGEYNGKSYTLHLTDDPDQLYEWCGPDAAACIVGSDIYSPKTFCESHLAHEIDHLFGNHWVDRPEVGGWR